MSSRLTPSTLMLLGALSVVLAGCGLVRGYNNYAEGPSAPGGETSVNVQGPGAFSQPAANLSTDEVARFRVGDDFFTEPWVEASTGSPERDGLGPTFLATSCAACHIGDGRSSAPGADSDESIGVLGFTNGHGGRAILDDYADQLQAFGIPSVPSEGSFSVDWVEISGEYADGTPYVLRRPEVRATGNFSDLSDRTALSVRLAPQLIGLGLLEAIATEEIVSGADPDDADGDGVSGRLHYVRPLGSDVEVLGRFGHKANVASVEDQTAIAYLRDLGITSPLLPGENCPPVQAACRDAESGGFPEIGDERFDDVVFYTQTLAVPSRPFAEDASVIEGSKIFESLGCDSCHVRRWTTGDHEIEALSNQTIYPYTDLLLHDMGEGLSDGRSDGDAAAREWKTPALWGLGLTRTVNSSAGFLHDGRARTIEEAVLWHGGESEVARNAFAALSEGDRERVINFLKSL
ncbi:MAG: di-heme oxidoredictase family protein [Acidimicrobiia bacterium]